MYEDLVQKEVPEENGGLESSSIRDAPVQISVMQLPQPKAPLALPSPPPHPHSAFSTSTSKGTRQLWKFPSETFGLKN